jgi:amino acid adenylation domain-containing protein
MTDSTKRIGDLSPAKLELLARRLKEKAADSGQTQQIRRRSVNGEPSPLSFAQERLWFIAQFDNEAPTHNITAAVRLEGSLNVPLLEQVLGEIIRRQESLRTIFEVFEGHPVQVAVPPTMLRLPLIDLSTLSAAEQAIQIRRLTAEEAGREFDLAKGPLLRTKLLRLSPLEHIVIQSTHHIVCDAWSSDVLMRELVTLYDAFAGGSPSPLAELSIQYADFAQWQRQWLQGGERFEEDLSYWRRQLSGIPPVLELPTDRPRPAVRSTSGDSEHFTLPESLTGALREFSRQREVTLFMTLLAAWQTLLHRYSGQADISVGIPTGGRSRLETEGLIGLFGNTLVLRGDLAQNPTFEEFLARMRRMALDAFTHQQMPFERLVMELQPERSLTHTPLFQVMFDLQKAGHTVKEMANVTLEPVEIERTVAEFDLSLAITEEEGRLTGAIDYRLELYDAATIRRMAGHYRRLVEAIVAEPWRRLSELPLLTPDEEDLLLVRWNDTSAPYSYDRCIHELFEEQAERTPDAIALMHEDRQLTYHELNRRANQLARYLRRHAITAEDVVGLCFERSVEMVVAILATLKAGGAYLALDPAYPSERLAFMLADAGVKLVLTREGLRESLPPHPARVLCLDEEEAIATEADGDLPPRAGSANAAYVVYTSGSTGRPKGVLVQHDSLVNYVEGANASYGLGAGDRMLQFASFSFDVSVEEAFIALTRGATLVLRTDAMLASAGEFLGRLREWQVTALELPTAYWHQLTVGEAGVGWAAAAVGPLRLLIIGGESARPERVWWWQGATGGRVQMFNACGPTEITIGATLYEVPVAAAGGGGAVRSEVPIGYPMPNYESYVLDGELRPVPVGVAGEMYVGGVGVTRGYLNRAEMTAERYVPHPYSERAGARLYRTGDLVRNLHNGEIELIQRTDWQVKIRGFRVELGEVEDTLWQHAAVREAVVLLREDDPGEKRLVAYLVAANGEPPHVDELRRFLRLKLPEHMIPTAFVMLAELPHTPQNKIDRKALSAPEKTRPSLEQSYVAPQTEMESISAGIWREALRIERVGIHDNFFDLGGHSLLMVEVQSKLQIALKREISMLDMFKYPTINELVKYLRNGASEQNEILEERVEKVREGKDRLRQQLKQRRRVSENWN